MKKLTLSIAAVAAATFAQFALAGPLDPECTPEKAAKSAATNAAVGVGGRCDAKEAASDSAKRATGVDDKKKPLDGKKNDTPAEKAKDKASKVTN